ncbi:DNA alkylation repair protein [Exiguobacterium flavidum]|uniref:DNA alkylation repair protein n=1 Tax=Exiguobacterium flavidum TaxID=2184695 RepID=UPI000DF7844A|nr:DNA alkylation repair protein [Exiguobacterium flavidum]
MSLIKDVFTREWLDRLGQELGTPDFSRRVLEADWDELAFKQRVRLIATTLGGYLPDDFDEAVSRLETIAPRFPGLPGIVFPDYVELHADDWERALLALERLTPHSSSEFAVRRFLLEDQDRFLLTAHRWSASEDEHVRRLASEGTRPRLPWGQAIPSLIADPSPVLPLLDRLLADESLYVRKSVANHLNDITKTHPEFVLERVRTRLGEHPHSDWVLRHASRTLLKQGHPEALQLFGFVTCGEVEVEGLSLEADSIPIGGVLVFAFDVTTTERERLRIEYAIDYVKKRGTSRKVFKISEGTVDGRKSVQKRQSFKDLTTRVHHPGRHHLTILVNGEAKADIPFEVI